MNIPTSFWRWRWSLGGGIPSGVKGLLIANGILYAVRIIVGPQIFFVLGLVPKFIWSRLLLWQVVTYLFIHGGFLHLILNMYTLWVFGVEIERDWGTKSFLQYYFITGIGAGIIHTLITPFSVIPTIGASGAVMGILTAYAVMYPDREITLLLFFILPVRIRARTLAFIFAGISLFGGVMGSPDGIAHFAHLGGMVVGYFYLKQDWKLQTLKNRYIHWVRKRKMRLVKMENEDLDHLRNTVDQILDKANEVGISHLTRSEKHLLKKASLKLRRKKHMNL